MGTVTGTGSAESGTTTRATRAGDGTGIVVTVVTVVRREVTVEFGGAGACRLGMGEIAREGAGVLRGARGLLTGGGRSGFETRGAAGGPSGNASILLDTFAAGRGLLTLGVTVGSGFGGTEGPGSHCRSVRSSLLLFRGLRLVTRLGLKKLHDFLALLLALLGLGALRGLELMGLSGADSVDGLWGAGLDDRASGSTLTLARIGETMGTGSAAVEGLQRRMGECKMGVKRGDAFEEGRGEGRFQERLLKRLLMAGNAVGGQLLVVTQRLVCRWGG